MNVSVADVAFSADTNMLAVAGTYLNTNPAQFVLIVFDPLTVGPLQSSSLLVSGVGSTRAVSLSPSGTYLASGFDDGSMRMCCVDLNASTRPHELNSLKGRYASSEVMYFSAPTWRPDGKQIAVGSSSLLVTVWDLNNDTNNNYNASISHVVMEAQSDPSLGPVTSMAWANSSNGQWRLVSSFRDGTVVIWSNIERGSPIGTSVPITSVDSQSISTTLIRTVACSGDGRRLAIAGNSYDGSVSMWDLTGSTLSATQESALTYSSSDAVSDEYLEASTNNTVAACVAFSPDSRYVATGNTLEWPDGSSLYSVLVWDVASGSTDDWTALDFHTYSICSVAFSPDSRYLASVSNGQVAVWSVANLTKKDSNNIFSTPFL